MNGQDLTPFLIRYAYAQGAFPMTLEDGSVEWFQPRRRALLPLSGIHVSRSLGRTIQRRTFQIRFDTAFEKVMRGCLRPFDNWISEDFIRVYTQIHQEGWGHSAECWRDGKLVGGVYGIALGSCFCGESMFHRDPNASKVALWAMVEKCRELGFKLFDAQIMNPHLKTLGAYEMANRQYLDVLSESIRVPNEWDGFPLAHSWPKAAG